MPHVNQNQSTKAYFNKVNQPTFHAINTNLKQHHKAKPQNISSTTKETEATRPPNNWTKQSKAKHNSPTYSQPKVKNTNPRKITNNQQVNNQRNHYKQTPENSKQQTI